MAASDVIARLAVSLEMDTVAFEKGVTLAEKQMARTTRSLEAVGRRMQSIGAKMSIGLTAPLTAFGVSAFNTASDAEELQATFNTTFGEMSDAMNKWAIDTGDAMGRSTQEMQRAANTFGMFFNQAADPRKAAEMSQIFSTLAQDLGSFFNVDTGVAIQKLRSGLSGESEPLRDFGVFLTEATVKAKGLEMGLGGLSGEMTEQEKILARYQLIMEATADAQGAATREAGSAAGRLRSTKAAFEELQVVIGTKLLPVITPLIEKIGAALEWFSKLPGPVQTTVVAFAGIAAAVGPLMVGIGGIVSGFGALLPVFTALGPLIGTVGTALLGLLANPIILGAAAVIAGIYLAWKNWDAITEIVSRVYNGVKTYIVDKLGAVWEGVKWAIGAYIGFYKNLYTTAIDAVSRLYNGVKTWLVDKLGAVWNWVGEKIEAVKRYFFDLYDAVVGHSYIPDMVDGIGRHMQRLDAVMVAPAEDAAAKVGAAFASISGLDGTGATAGIPGALETIGGAANDNADHIETANVRIAKSFKDMADDTLSALEQLTNAIKSGGFLGILEAVIGLGLQLGSVGAFGKKLQTRINSTVPAYANGTSFHPGGLAVVGERGPELVSMPRGSRVYPNGMAPAQRVEIVDTTGLFRFAVNGQIMEAAPGIAQAGSTLSQARMTRRDKWRLA